MGLGNVGSALVALLLRKRQELAERHGIGWHITAVASRRRGWLVNHHGFTPEKLLAGDFSEGRAVDHVASWMHAAKPDVVFEASSLNAETGEPAVTHIRTALTIGAHAISANKGPVVFAYRELTVLAEARHLRFYFESAMMDGAPVFSLFRESLPAIEIHGFRGVINSTTTVVLEAMQAGKTFAEAIAEAQRLGVAETDPSADIDGIDAAVKVVEVANVLMGASLKLADVRREGIRGIKPAHLTEAALTGESWRLVSRARRQPDGRILASVGPERLKLDDPLAQVRGTSLLIAFETDIFKELVISERDPGPEATAYGMLADFVNAVRNV
ncbi:MAG TPA: homoserine dehydrogenase [Candidatus Angelobacter sp.]|nr:homoserine dehydrogenase [Candidatus Angelobacter sp.]